MNGILDMGDALGCIDQEICILRTLPGRWINGLYHKNNFPSISVIDAVSMPANAKEIEMLPEGQRTRETISLFSREKIDLTRDGEEPDMVKVDGVVYEPVWSLNWSRLGGYYQYLCVRVGQ